MRIEYDDEADALYIQLREVRPHHVVDVEGVDGLSVDVDRTGKPVGIEILRARRLLGRDLEALTWQTPVGTSDIRKKL